MTPVFLPWEDHEQYEKPKYITLENEPAKSEGIQYATGEEQSAIKSSRKNAQSWMCLVVIVKSDAVKKNKA